MKYLTNAFFAFVLMLSLNLYSQNNKVIAGPMVSFIDSYGTQMWFLLESDTEKITVDVRDYDTDKLMKYDNYSCSTQTIFTNTGIYKLTCVTN